MTEFTPYPGAAEAGPASPRERYVVAVTSNLDRGVYAPDPVTEPMSLEEAQALLERIARGEPVDVFDEELDLMAEVGPDQLLGFRSSTVLSRAATFEIRIARVVWSR